MQRVDVRKLCAPSSIAEKHQLAASLSSRLRTCLRIREEYKFKLELRKLASQFAPAIKLSDTQLLGVIRDAFDGLTDNNGFSEVSITDSEFLTNVAHLCAEEDVHDNRTGSAVVSGTATSVAETVVNISAN